MVALALLRITPIAFSRSDVTAFNRQYRPSIEFFLYVSDALIAGGPHPGPTVTQPDGAVEYKAVRTTKRIEAKIALPFELHRLAWCHRIECCLDAAFDQRFERHRVQLGDEITAGVRFGAAEERVIEADL